MASVDQGGSVAVLSSSGSRWMTRVAVGFVVVGSAGLLMVNQPSIWSYLFERASQGIKVASITIEMGSVRQKSSRSPLWHDLGEGESVVSRNDSIYTGGDGKAELHFDNGSVTTLWPNSLVVIETIPNPRKEIKLSTKDISLKIEQGNVSVKTGDTAVRIQKGQKTFMIKENQSQPIDITVDPNDRENPVKFAGANGEAAVTEVGANQSARSVSVAKSPSDAGLKRTELMKKIAESRSKQRERYMEFFKKSNGIKNKFLVGFILSMIIGLIVMEVYFTSRSRKH